MAAYVTATPSGAAGQPTLGVFTNDVSSTGGMSRVTVRHLAVAPTVGVYGDGSVAVTPAVSNGQTATAVVPPNNYGVTVTAPNAARERARQRGHRLVDRQHQHARLRHRRLLHIHVHRGGAGGSHRRAVASTGSMAPGSRRPGAIASQDPQPLALG